MRQFDEFFWKLIEYWFSGTKRKYFFVFLIPIASSGIINIIFPETTPLLDKIFSQPLILRIGFLITVSLELILLGVFFDTIMKSLLTKNLMKNTIEGKYQNDINTLMLLAMRSPRQGDDLINELALSKEIFSNIGSEQLKKSILTQLLNIIKSNRNKNEI